MKSKTKVAKKTVKFQLTMSNLKFYKKLKPVVGHFPDITLEEIGFKTGLTSGGVSWHMVALKKAKYIKRDRKGLLSALK